ncbi:MAG: Thymidylate kinase [candidate division BRC1 bacterium ADurb.BinA364]|nr:MAG: Thymidylate kinase [candidate division BRC1 bacterium ADurb.BinA364]
MSGLLIVFEGIDGAGKSTQLKRLGMALRARGRDVVELKEPTEGPHGQELRRLQSQGRRANPRRERDLFKLDRMDDARLNILPALERGAVVLLDRYYLSTMAYQGALGFDPEAIRKENEAFAPRPDLAIVFDLPVEEALRRVAERRGGQADAFERADTLRRAKAIFDSLGDPWIFRVDARRGEDEIAALILRRVEEMDRRRPPSESACQVQG